MLIEKAITLLNEFAESKKDNEFKEFAKNLALFILKYKNEYDINDMKVFANLIKQNTDDEDREQLKRAISSISLAEECIQNGFVDYEKFYINFREYMTNVFLTQESIDKDILESNADKDNTTNELLESLQDLIVLSEDYQNKKRKIKKLQEVKENNDFYIPKDEKATNSIHSPSTNEMLSFIKDKEKIHFPFSKEETLDNKFFMLEFNQELKRMSSQEIQKLVDNIRAKNEALRQEIKEIDEQKTNLMKELKKGLIDNQKLSTLNEINQKDAVSKLGNESSHNSEETPKQQNQKKNFYRKNQ